MLSALVVCCGLTAVAISTWRSYVLAREALVPPVRDGDPTRAALERSQPLTRRPAVRRFARNVILSVGWLLVSLYGLYLVVAGGELTR